MSAKHKDTEKKDASALADREYHEVLKDEISERNLERAVKRGMNAPSIKVVSRLLLSVLIIIAVTAFVTGLMKYSELQSEKQLLEQKVEEYEAEVEKLEYLIDSPVDYHYIVRIAKEKLNLYLPDEIIYYNDSNGK